MEAAEVVTAVPEATAVEQGVGDLDLVVVAMVAHQVGQEG